MRGYFGIGAVALLAGCGANVAPPPVDTVTEAALPESCGSVDAIGFRCENGKVVSVRHDAQDTGCVVVFAGETTYALPRTATEGDTDIHSDGRITYRRRGDVASLNGAPDGPCENCELER